MNERRYRSGQLTIDFQRIESGEYSKITEAVVAEFDLEPASPKTAGLDEISQKFRKGNEVVSLEWDIWSGYIVGAEMKTAEPLVREIAIYISSRFSS